MKQRQNDKTTKRTNSLQNATPCSVTYTSGSGSNSYVRQGVSYTFSVLLRGRPRWEWHGLPLSVRNQEAFSNPGDTLRESPPLGSKVTTPFSDFFFKVFKDSRKSRAIFFATSILFTRLVPVSYTHLTLPTILLV